MSWCILFKDVVLISNYAVFQIIIKTLRKLQPSVTNDVI